MGRLLAPWALIAVLLTSAVLASSGWLYSVALILQLCFYCLAALGGWIESAERQISAPRESAYANPDDAVPRRAVSGAGSRQFGAG